MSVLDDLCLGKNLSRFKGTGEMFNQKTPQVKRLLALDITWHHLTLYLAKLQLDSISPRTVIPLFPSPWAFPAWTFRCQDWGVSSHFCTNLLWPNGTNKGQPTYADINRTSRAPDEHLIKEVWRKSGLTISKGKTGKPLPFCRMQFARYGWHIGVRCKQIQNATN